MGKKPLREFARNRQLSLRLTEDVYERARELARIEETSLSLVCYDAIEEYLNKKLESQNE